MGSIDEFLKFVPEGKTTTAAASGLDGDVAIRPSVSGLKWIDTPSGLSNGIAFRLTTTSLELLQVVEASAAAAGDDEAGGDSSSSTANIISRCPLNVPGVNITSSSDGRLVAVACIDGSIKIYNATSEEGLSERSVIPNCHSHTSSDVFSSPTKDRAKAALLSGPITTMAFNNDTPQSPSSTSNFYHLLVVDASMGIAVYDAAQQSTPQNLLLSKPTENVSCAAWNPSTTKIPTDASASPYVVLGQFDGSVELVRVKKNVGDSTLEFEAVASLGEPAIPEDGGGDYCCTHLNWMPDDTIVVGLCHVTPSEDDDDDDDDDDEDDTAEHVACLCTTILSPEITTATATATATATPPNWENHEDVVPFFSVPKHGRHAFFTAFVDAVPNHQLILVAANVGSDVAVLTRTDEGGDTTWHLAELDDGAGATTPTDDDDEFTFPTGLSTVQLPSSAAFRLLVEATDGSTSSFDIVNTNDDGYFTAPIRCSVEPLPAVPVEYTTTEIGNETTAVVVEKQAVVNESNVGSASTSFSFGTGSVEASPAQVPVPSFSSPSKAFGSGSGTSLSFGSSGPGTTSPFAAFTPKAAAGSSTESSVIAGAPSPFGAFAPKTGGSPTETSSTSPFAFGGSSAAKPAQGSTSTFSFGGNAAAGSSFSFGTSTVAAGAGVTENQTPGFSFGSASTSLNPPVASTLPKSSVPVVESSPSNTKEDAAPILKDEAQSTDTQTKQDVGSGAEEEPQQQQVIAKEQQNDNEAVDASVDSDEREIIATEVSKLKGSFEKLSTTSTDGSDRYITADQFRDVMDALEITYDEGVHGKVKSDLTDDDGNIHEKDMVDWYVKWLSGDGEDESDDKSDHVELVDEREEDESGSDSTEAKRASKVFDTFDKENAGTLPVSSLEALIDELGEGFSGDEFDEQVAMLDPSNTGTVSKKAFVDWYVNLLNDADDDGSMDTEEREERAEEAQTAKENFGLIAKNCLEDKKGPYILKEQFQQLLESFGTVYCEEEHTRSLRKLVQPNGRIYEAAFVDWYVEYLFGGDESSVESSDDEHGEDGGREDGAAGESNVVPSLASVFNQAAGSGWKCDVCAVPNKETSDACVACGTKNPNAPTAAPAAPSLASVFNQGSGSGWKCDVCSVPNKDTSDACVACGTKNPNAPATAPVSTSLSSSTGNKSSAFSFGAPSTSSTTAAPSKPTFGFGAPSSSTSSENKEQTTKPSSGGFSFGAPSASSTTAAPSKQTFGFGAPSASTRKDASNQATGGFSFGAPSTTTTASSQNPSVGFSFGAPSSTSSSSDSKEQGVKNSSTPATGFSFGAASPTVEKASAASPAPTTKTAASSSVAAFPPMSKAAPKPFSSGIKAPAPTPAPKPAAAAFPPMSSTAPKPFGGGGVTKSPAPAPAPRPAAAAFPPMSSTAPKPFGGGIKAPAPTPAPKPAAAAFPPMSSTAPKPFGGGGVTKSPAPAPAPRPAAAAFPPMSSTAPKPFGGGIKAPAAAPKPAAAAFPPMSSTAPKPFGGGGVTKSPAPAPAPKPAAATFPPMSSTAPKPFGGGIKAPTPAPKPAAAAFPPMSSTAPKPFGGGIKAPAPAAAFPPMSSTAPKPFGGGIKAPAPAAAFPPMSSTAPKPFGSTSKEPAPKPASAASFGKTSGQRPAAQSSLPPQTHSGDAGRSISVPQVQLSKAAKQMQVLVQDMDKMNESTFVMGQKMASASSNLEPKAEGLIVATNRYRQQLFELDDASKEMKEQRSFALSRNTDSKRQAAGAKKSLSAIRSSSALSDGVHVNNLDADSEFARRNIAASAISIARRVVLAKERIGTMEKLNEGNVAPLSQQIMKIYKQSKAFDDSTIPRIANKIQTNHRKLGGGASTTSGKYEFVVDDDDDADVGSPAPIQQVRHTSREADRTQNVSCWKSIEGTLSGLESVECNFDNLQPHGRAQKAPQPPARLTGDGTSNLLLSQSPFRNPGSERAGRSNIPKTSIFSPPSTSRPRSAWETPSTIEQVEMKKQFTSMPVPTTLPETSLLDSAKTTLVGFSTTPEKLKAAVEASTFVPSSKAPTAVRKVPASSVTTPISMSKTPTVAKLPSANEAKIDSQKKAPPAPAFPPLSAAAPKNPFSSIVKDNKKKPEASSTTTTASQGGLGQFISSSSPAPAPPPAPSSLEGMGGLGASLFSGSDQSKQSNAGGSFLSASSAPGLSLNTPALGSSTSSSSTTTDYKSMLTNFYQKHNPSKVIDVDKHLQKYQGHEKELFAKLAKKYNTVSPLDENAAASNKPITAFGSPSASNAPPASPFAPSVASTNSTPFGSTANTGSTPFPSSAPSPFSSAPKTGTSAFGLGMAPAASPFGSSSGPSPSPFGGAPAVGGFTSALGAPAPAAGRLFNGKTAREMLTAFYQERDPSKLANVDKLLSKYQGKEEQMFQALAKKNNIPASVFGVSDQPSSAPVAPPTASPGFGQQSALGSGIGAGGAFGSGGGAFGSPSHSFGSAAGQQGGASFGALAGGGGTFGAPGAAASPFGAGATGAASPFGAGTPTPFGAPRR